METQNVFADLADKAWPFEYRGRLHVDVIAGGVPSDPNVAEGWIRSKIQPADDERIARVVAQHMVDMNLPMTPEGMDKAVDDVNKLKHTNGFKRDPELGLYIEGRQLKAAIKEAISVAVASPEGKLDVRGWGNTKKFLTNYAPEHVFVVENRLYLRHASDGSDPDTGAQWKEGDPFHTATRVLQSFPVNARIKQSGIQYTEVAEDAYFDFTIVADHPFTREEWAMIWLTGQYQGVGAQRSQGYGVYTPVTWDQVRGRVVTTSSKGKPPAEAESGADG